jgi:hypothetical protein
LRFHLLHLLFCFNCVRAHHTHEMVVISYIVPVLRVVDAEIFVFIV